MAVSVAKNASRRGALGRAGALTAGCFAGSLRGMGLTGECFCGAIKYTIRGRIYGLRSCHCSRCRKAFGAQASAYAQIDPGTLHWEQGASLLTTYLGRHGAGKQFCSRCGSTLCGVVDEQVHGIALGCLNEAPPELELTTHIFVGSKATWERLPEGIIAHETFPPGPIE